MTSAVLPNQPSWGPRMGKLPYSNNNNNNNPRFNPNPNPKKKQKISLPSHPLSEDAYSYNQTSTSHGETYGGYVTFNLSSYSKRELFELRKRFAFELDQIRDLRRRVETGQMYIDQNPRSHSHSQNVVPFVSNVSNISNHGLFTDVNFEPLLKECGKIVPRLIKHKYGPVFKSPVDAVGMGLHDYYAVVKKPMDLGTVKKNLSKNVYRTPMEFEDDIRLIFENALLYNPKGDPYNDMAEVMLSRFEEIYRPIKGKVDCLLASLRKENEFRDIRVVNEEVVKGNVFVNRGNGIVASPMRGKKARVSKKEMLVKERVVAMPVVEETKTKGKELGMRFMSMEEKEKLGAALQSLPQKELGEVIDLVRERNPKLSQQGDEFELDFEALDLETLWDLDRFVNNWKKSVCESTLDPLVVSGKDPDPGMAALANPVGADAAMGAMSDDEDVDIDDDLPATTFPPVEIEKDDVNVERIDIDDDLPAMNFPPVEILKDEVNVDVGVGGGQDHGQNDRGNASSSSSSSGSSSSDSSSSSGSDSGSSSGSDSDADDAQS